MNTTQELIEEVKSTCGIRSDYAVAKRFGWSTSRIASYRTGRSQLDVEGAFQVAEVLGKEPALVIAAVEAERATKPETRAAWIQRLKQLGGVAAMWAFFAVISALPAPAEARFDAVQHSGISHPNICTLLFSELMNVLQSDASHVRCGKLSSAPFDVFGAILR